MAAHRYCLGRQSYIVGACIEWLKGNWDKFDDSTRNVLVRDTLEALMDECGVGQIDPEGLNWVRYALGHKKESMPDFFRIDQATLEAADENYTEEIR